MFWAVIPCQSALTFILLVASVLVVGASQKLPDNAKKHAGSLLVAPSAIDPQYLSFPDGREQLTYMLEAEYPAESTISFVSTELQKRHWEALRDDFLNPSIQSSLRRGWMWYEDASREPRANVRQWACDWEDADHNITAYDLKYRYPMSGAHDPPDTKMLHVVALYIPARVAEKMKRATKPDQPKK